MDDIEADATEPPDSNSTSGERYPAIASRMSRVRVGWLPAGCFLHLRRLLQYSRYSSDAGPVRRSRSTARGMAIVFSSSCS